MSEEIWKEWLVGFLVSNKGRIIKLASTRWNGYIHQKVPEKLISQCKSAQGYLVVNIQHKVRLVHRIVMEVFNPIESTDKLDVNHKDGNKTNNDIENLEWCTRKQNIVHAFKTGLVKVGEKHHSAKISEYTVRQILKIHKETGFKKTRLHKEFFPSVSVSNIQSILDGKNWKHIPR